MSSSSPPPSSPSSSLSSSKACASSTYVCLSALGRVPRVQVRRASSQMKWRRTSGRAREVRTRFFTVSSISLLPSPSRAPFAGRHSRRPRPHDARLARLRAHANALGATRAGNASFGRRLIYRAAQSIKIAPPSVASSAEAAATAVAAAAEAVTTAANQRLPIDKLMRFAEQASWAHFLPSNLAREGRLPSGQLLSCRLPAASSALAVIQSNHGRPGERKREALSSQYGSAGGSVRATTSGEIRFT